MCIRDRGEPVPQSAFQSHDSEVRAGSGTVPAGKEEVTSIVEPTHVVESEVVVAVMVGVTSLDDKESPTDEAKSRCRFKQPLQSSTAGGNKRDIHEVHQ